MVWCFGPDLGGIQLFLVQNRSYLKHPSPSLLFLDLFDGPQIGQAAKKRKPWKARVPGKVREGSECQMSQWRSRVNMMTQPLLQTSGIESYDVPWEWMYGVFAYIDPLDYPNL